MAEIAATSGYDWLLIDGEHAPNTIQDLYHQLQAIAPYASQPVIRPVEGNRSLIKQVLDIGARTLLIPMVDTAEQAREIVSATRYAAGYPRRGAGVARAARWGRVENYMAQANDELCLLIQVESKTALDNLDAILKWRALTACLSARRISRPRWATRITPVILKCSGLLNRASAAFARREAAGFLAVDPEMAHKALAWGRILSPLASIPTFTPARWINGWRCSSR
jgi:2-dehydro-3-deoxy-L-rhamnonate aldolase